MHKGSHLLVSKSACRAGVCILQKLQDVREWTCQPRVHLKNGEDAWKRSEFHLLLWGTWGETEQENMQSCEPLPELTSGPRSFPILTSSDYTNERSQLTCRHWQRRLDTQINRSLHMCKAYQLCVNGMRWLGGSQCSDLKLLSRSASPWQENVIYSIFSPIPEESCGYKYGKTHQQHLLSARKPLGSMKRPLINPQSYWKRSSQSN